MDDVLKVTEETLKVSRERVESEAVSARAAAARAELPLQRKAHGLQDSELEFGTIYTRDEVHRRVRKAAPFRLFRVRSTRWSRIHNYAGLIPDVALARYVDAKGTGKFREFWIVEPCYADQIAKDPWLLGQLDGNYYIVLAYWE